MTQTTPNGVRAKAASRTIPGSRHQREQSHACVQAGTAGEEQLCGGHIPDEGPIANGPEYGSAGAVWRSDTSKAPRVAGAAG